ncbi:MAG: hypothetical protein ACOXZR_02330 [Bacilli bacterium]|jgi:capsule polysaccharide export protein KpsE/RkpR
MTKRNRNRKKKKENITEINDVIKTIIIVLVIFIGFYVLTIFLTKNQLPIRNKENIIAVIQYKEILAGETFNKPEKEYYVLFFNHQNKEKEIYNLIIERYENNLPIYTVDLENGFNQSIVKENSNKEAQNVSSLQINQPTLIKIKEGRNILYKEGQEEIKKILNN